MGTSISQGSPNTINWGAALLAYKTDSVPIKRAVEEMWLAATNQEQGDIASNLKDHSIRELFEISINSSSREDALNQANRHAAQSESTTLATHLAIRALIKSFNFTDHKSAFTKCLFMEASNYLISRDLPSYIGKGARAENVKEALELKKSLLDQVRKRVESTKQPSNLVQQKSWINYVNQVIYSLSGLDRDE